MNFDFGEIFGQKMRNFRLDFIMIIKIQIGKVYYKKKGQFPEFCPSLFLLPKFAICQNLHNFTPECEEIHLLEGILLYNDYKNPDRESLL